MVGYRHNDPMTSSQKLVAGVVSGVMTRFVTQPMDVIKLRAQLIKKPKKHSVLTRIAKKIFWEEGIRAFWQGHSLGQFHSVLSVSSQFYVYELATSYTIDTSLDKQHRAILSFLCGMLAGCVSTTLVIPLEVIRVRQVLVHDQYRGIIHGARNVYKTGGILAFYEGLGASLLQMGPSVGISFTTFRVVQGLILSLCETKHCSAEKRASGECHDVNLHQPSAVMMASSVAGSIAGFVSKTLTYPFDLAKRRLQIGSHISDKRYKIPSQVTQLAQCKTLSECFYQAYKKEGIKGFFRGWTVTIYKAQLTSIVAFTTYEMICFMIREFDVA